MTERHKGYVVHLSENFREDDSQAVIEAIKMIKGVVAVEPVTADFKADVIAVRNRDLQWRVALDNLMANMRGLPAVIRHKDGP